MIKRIIVLTLALMCAVMAFADNTPQWIWQQEDGPANTWVAFRKTIDLNEVPAEVMVKISVDTKYWLWINGEMVLFEGGLARGAAPNTIYYDPVDFAPFLKEGQNTIAILVWYWGNTHKTHEDSGKGGLCLSSTQMPELNTNASWKMKVHPAYDPTSGGNSSANRVQAYNVKFDGRKALGDWTANAWYTEGYDDSAWSVPSSKGTIDSQPWGTWVERAIPQWNDRGLADYTALKIGSTAVQLPYTNNTGANVKISATLPFNQQITPYLKVNSTGGKTLVMDTDNGSNLLTGTYITKAGTQQFESYTWFNGHNVEYTIPAGVEVLELKYRWTGVGEMTGTFECNDDFYSRLWWMARNTLYVCARDNYMDCPDRERGLWIGDVADQAGAIFYTLDEAGRKLLKKAIDNTIAYRDGDIIQGLAPGFGDYRGESSELVSQSLQFIIQGIWQYYYNTGDTATMANAYPAILNYLKIWNMQSNGMPEYRKGYANWVDWGDNSDTYPTTFIWYYMALQTAKDMAVLTEQHQDTTWYNTRIKSIEDNFESIYWRGTHYGTAGRVVEERVTSLAVLSGLAKEEYYDVIVENNLFPVREASPHMEWMVEEALVLAGYPDKALQRMKERYASQVNRTNLTTLYEKFPSGGTPNHAWNAPNYVLSRYVAGVRATEVAWKTFEVLPILTDLTSVKSVVPTVKGDISVDINATTTSFSIALNAPAQTMAIVGIPKANREIINIKVGDKTIWENNAFVNNVQGIAFYGEDDDYLKFEVIPGQWMFNAEVLQDNAPVVSFIAPTSNTKLAMGYDELEVKLNVSDDKGIAKVELYLDNVLIATKETAPFQWSSAEITSLLNWSAGAHTLRAVATDTKGQSSKVSMIVDVVDSSVLFTGEGQYKFYNPSQTKWMGYDVATNDALVTDAGDAEINKFNVVTNGDKYNIFTSDYAKVVVISSALGYTSMLADTNPEVLASDDALFSFTETGVGTELYFIASGADYKLNVKSNGSDIGRGTSELPNYQWQLTRIGDIEASINEQFVRNAVLQVFPNPANNRVYFEGATVKQAKIFTLSGQMMISTLDVNDGVDVSQLESGLYLIQLEDAKGQVFNQKMVKE